MKAFFIPADRDMQEPFASGSLNRILSTAEQMHPGIEFWSVSPDSDEELEGIIFTADLPNGKGSIIIVDGSYRA